MDRMYFEKRRQVLAKSLHSAIDLALRTAFKVTIVIYLAVFVLYSVSIGPVLRVFRVYFGFRPIETELEHAFNEWSDETNGPIAKETRKESLRFRTRHRSGVSS